MVRVLWAWTILANRADPKSSEKWWIFFVSDSLISFINQLTMSNSKNTGITVSLTEDFCNNARQNLCITEPFFSSSMIYLLSKNYLHYLFYHTHIFLVSNVLNSSQGTAYNTDQRYDGVSEFGIGVFEQLQQEIKPLILLNLEQVIPYQLVD